MCKSFPVSNIVPSPPNFIFEVLSVSTDSDDINDGPNTLTDDVNTPFEKKRLGVARLSAFNQSTADDVLIDDTNKVVVEIVLARNTLEAVVYGVVS